MLISLYKKCGNFAYFFNYYSLKIAVFEADGPIRVIYYVLIDSAKMKFDMMDHRSLKGVFFIRIECDRED